MFSIALLLFLSTFLACLSLISISRLSRTGLCRFTVGVRFALTLGVVFAGLMGIAGNFCDEALEGREKLDRWGGVLALNMKGSDNDRSPEWSLMGSVNAKLSYSNCGTTCWAV